MKTSESLKQRLISVIPNIMSSRFHPRYSVEKISGQTYAYVRMPTPEEARKLELDLLNEGFDVNRGYWIGGTTVEVQVSR